MSLQISQRSHVKMTQIACEQSVSVLPPPSKPASENRILRIFAALKGYESPRPSQYSCPRMSAVSFAAHYKIMLQKIMLQFFLADCSANIHTS